MKLKLGCLTVLLICSFTTSTALAEGIRPDSFTLSGILGGYSFDGVQHLETRPVVGLRGGYNLTEHFGVELLFDYIPTESTIGLGDAEGFRYGGDALLYLMPERKIVPYIAAGYGGITINRDNQPSFSAGIFDYGPGVEYFLNDDLALRGDFRHLVFRDVNTLFNYEYTVGVVWHFGGKPAPVPVAAPEVKKVEPVPAPVQQPPREASPAPVPAAEPAPGHYKYCVTLHIEFDIDRAFIRPQYHDEVAKVGDFMRKYPATTAVIEGYTDNVGTREHNLELSRSRAESVVTYLVDHFGINRSRLSAVGYGPDNPVADNATDEGKQKNRRIEAIIDCAFDVKKVKPPERLCMSLQIEFDSGSYDIKPRYRDEIAKVADYMNTYPTTTAVIEGHTDNVGSPAYNLKLSKERAESVVNYLVDNFGIDRSRLSAKGFGNTRRIAYNDTAEGRKKNRRINAVIDCVIKK